MTTVLSQYITSGL